MSFDPLKTTAWGIGIGATFFGLSKTIPPIKRSILGKNKDVEKGNGGGGGGDDKVDNDEKEDDELIIEKVTAPAAAAAAPIEKTNERRLRLHQVHEAEPPLRGGLTEEDLKRRASRNYLIEGKRSVCGRHAFSLSSSAAPRLIERQMDTTLSPLETEGPVSYRDTILAKTQWESSL